MKSIRMMIEELALKNFQKLCLPYNDGESKEMLKNYSNKLISMGKAWYYLTNSQHGPSRKTLISIPMTMLFDNE